MKKLSLIFFLILTAISMSAATDETDISYVYKPLDKDGCYVRFSAVRENETPYLYVYIRNASAGLTFTKNPVLKLKNSDGQVIKVTGTYDGTITETTTKTIFKKEVYSKSKELHVAKFALTEQQVDLLKMGVKKIFITTTPFIHERDFKSDKIGMPLYQSFMKQKGDNF